MSLKRPILFRVGCKTLTLLWWFTWTLSRSRSEFEVTERKCRESGRCNFQFERTFCQITLTTSGGDYCTAVNILCLCSVDKSILCVRRTSSDVSSTMNSAKWFLGQNDGLWETSGAHHRVVDSVSRAILHLMYCATAYYSDWRAGVKEHSPSVRWRGGVTGKAFGLVINRSQVQILLEATLRNNLRQVVYTYVPLSPSSITWYRPKGGDALRLGR